jgi:hypothetical protein
LKNEKIGASLSVDAKKNIINPEINRKNCENGRILSMMLALHNFIWQALGVDLEVCCWQLLEANNVLLSAFEWPLIK